MPRVSVIIPTYNRLDYVQEAIDSVLAQTYTDYELIVVDDGSTDGTGDTLKARYGDRIRYLWQENQGWPAARNHGVSIAQGEYIAQLDSDDLWLPEKLVRQVPVLDACPEAVLVFSHVMQIDAEGGVEKQGRLGRKALHRMRHKLAVYRTALSDTGPFEAGGINELPVLESEDCIEVVCPVEL